MHVGAWCQCRRYFTFSPLYISAFKMIFSVQLYEKMKAVAYNAIISNSAVTPNQAEALNVDFDALMSLYSQMFIRNLKLEVRSVTDGRMQSIVCRVNGGESLLEIAKEFHFGSFKFAKMYLEAIGEWNIQPSSLPTNPDQIKDKRIQTELLKLIESDPSCAPDVEHIKECMGHEYEDMLIKLLNEKNMCFETESEMRSKGKPKTPDIFFLIPMAITCTELDMLYLSNGAAQYTNTPLDDCASPTAPGCVSNARSISGGGIGNVTVNANSSSTKVVINWIDSKAMFADEETFRENLEQFRGYTHRYGRGMVIYWHGFVRDICGSLQDDMIILRDHLPDEWMFPTGEIADGRKPAFDNIVF